MAWRKYHRYMAGAPLSDSIAGRLVSTTTREINNEYHLGLIADDSKLLRSELLAIRKGQVGAAVLNREGQMEILRNLDVGNQLHRVSNELLGGLAGDMYSLLGEAERTNEHLVAIEGALEQLNETIQQGFDAVVGELTQVVSMLQQNQKKLTEIGYILRNPNETEALEFLRKGVSWLVTAEKTIGPDQHKLWNHALEQFRSVVDNKIGKDMYVAWFNIGYLSWKHLGDLVEAEKAFDQAQLFSAPSRNLWHTKSLRYMAGMQDKQGDFERAWQTINRALAVNREYNSLYAAARFAWKTNRRAEATELLDECIELVPETIDDMFGEEDFQQ